VLAALELLMNLNRDKATPQKYIMLFLDLPKIDWLTDDAINVFPDIITFSPHGPKIHIRQGFLPTQGKTPHKTCRREEITA